MINLKSIYGFRSFISSTDILLNIDLSFSVDNRKLDDENIFIAIVGERFNPLDHIEKIISSECRFVIYEANPENDLKTECFKKHLVFIRVENIISFIEEAGKAVANNFRTKGGKIIAISGSNGKTTTKEMLYHLLSDVFGDEKVICTQKNNNNHLGVPFTLFDIRERTLCAIVELGSNHPGEIEVLARILYPQYAVTTNIGETHLEFFNTVAAVFKEESCVEQYVENCFYQNADDVYLKNLVTTDLTKTYGFLGKDYQFKLFEGGIEVNGHRLCNQNITGDHNYFNLALAYTMALDIFNVSKKSLIESVKTFQPTKNRSEWITHKNHKIFLDAYNANPSSMLAAVDGFNAYIIKNKISLDNVCIVIGDMNELGEKSSHYHVETGKKLNLHKFGQAYFVGIYAKQYAEGYQQSCKCFESTKEVIAEYDNLFAKYKYVFIKGSRSLQLESILDIR
ncbi:MAG: UDP-N-acetylmuramoyl-tripeptide--D-alanyl-D-alanine ligase [Halobacteriovoraceae bacterium]|jgi:UDP-N-acetylmuramoyl-tripeptide--D-alanyl-D-alanine ligase|nr:UDP-N-acetylmuramoyl-tripeptide--D-alanyl-D-alanine ligase [Halobacteriovoraceae bacterium]